MWKRETKTRNASRFPLNNIRTQLRLKDEICMYRRNGDAGTLERGEDPCEAHSRVGHRLPHSPHHGMNWNLDNGHVQNRVLLKISHHAKIGMFVHKGNGARRKKTQRKRNDQPHYQNHHTVKPEKNLVVLKPYEKILCDPSMTVFLFKNLPRLCLRRAANARTAAVL